MSDKYTVDFTQAEGFLVLLGLEKLTLMPQLDQNLLASLRKRILKVHNDTFIPQPKVRKK